MQNGTGTAPPSGIVRSSEGVLSLDRVQEVGEGEGGVVRARGQRAAPKHGCGSGGATGHPPQRWER